MASNDREEALTRSFDVETGKRTSEASARAGKHTWEVVASMVVVILLVLAFVAGIFHVKQASAAEMPGVGPEATGDGSPPFSSSASLSKVMRAAAQGATAAAVSAMLSAISEPIMNRLLVSRMTLAQAYNELYLKDVAKFFLTTFPTNMLKFPVFEMVNIIMSFTKLPAWLRGVANGFLFCTLMLPVTNYRLCKSLNLEIKASNLYKAYIPTVARDIVYGWSRSVLKPSVNSFFRPHGSTGKAMAFGLVIWISCIISSPGNEWRGYTLQPAEKKLPFKEYFKPANYVRSVGVFATIMAISLAAANLITPYVEALVTTLGRLVFG
eukprot:TRINITY_DN15612_c0_g4_i1.p1 TRINITY_DN15612_c0_g4~~TRINITY_DN15612_c0_g4_i1.p1  ORF type:complete len:324 (-),score=55.23 TRINITY_DN15612_c0_g4_i1:235-1206(-)